MRRIVLSLALTLLLVTTMLVLGQGSGVAQPSLRIKVSNQSCDMAQNVATTPEATVSQATVEASAATEEANVPSYPLITLGNDCANVLTVLHVPDNDTLWIALWADENESPWQQFKRVPGDEHAPKLDTRGRFVGCAIPDKGEQTCRVLWLVDETTYEINIPVTVRDAYVAPPTRVAVPTAVPTIISPVPVSTPNSGLWGECGSCTTCGGPVEHCVLAPDNTCVWDARRCENPQHPDPSH